jgi:predicted S18 family serine protease
MKRLAVLSFTIATLIAPTFSQASAGLDATQPAVEATTKAAASGVQF